MIVPYDTQLASELEQAFNIAMSRVETAVECSYKDVKQNFTMKDFNRLLMVRKSPVAMMYKASAVLWNFKLCIHHGGQVSSYFACLPPSNEDFLWTIYKEETSCFKKCAKMECIRSFAVI